MYDRAVAWTDKKKPNDPELRQFRAEAAALLGLPWNKPTSEKQHCEKKRIGPTRHRNRNQSDCEHGASRYLRAANDPNGTERCFCRRILPCSEAAAAETPATGCENTAARVPGRCFRESLRA